MAGKRSWTNDQRQAIEAPPGDLLVSAGAGAGKTAVLVERVLRRITDPEAPVDVDRLLVVTFTEAAAAEMKTRIAQRLDELLAERPDDPLLGRQLALLPRAAISTIHSFCLRLIRRYFHKLELDPAVTVVDNNAAAIMRHDVLAELLEQRLTAVEEGRSDQGFVQLIRSLGGRSGDALTRIVLEIHRLAVTQPDPESWLDSLVQPFTPGGDLGPLLEELKTGVRFTLEQCLWRIKQAMALCQLPGGPADYLETLADDQSLLQSLLAALGNLPWPQLAPVFQEAGLSRLRSIRSPEVDIELREQVKDLRDEVRDSLKRLRDEFFSTSFTNQQSQMNQLEPAIRALVQLVRDFDQAYAAAKDAVGGIDYNDLERYCLQLLCEDGDPSRPSPTAQELAALYDEVVVDEYQDINPLQDAILSLLAGAGDGTPRRFMVGDVRQSIYRFRLAEPALFLHRRETYPTDPGSSPRRIELKRNFRSRAQVLNAVNFLFRQLFSTSVGQLGFADDARLEPGLDYPGPDPVVELHVLERDPGELARTAGVEEEANVQAMATRPDEREAVFVARMIRRLLGMDGEEPATVWDGDAGTRPLRPGDIAILLRSPRHRANMLVEILAAHQIPATAELRTGYLDAVEVSIFLNLLRLIDNPRQDIPLASVLLSPIGGLTPEDLAQVRLASAHPDFHAACREAREPAALVEFWGKLDRWRTQARHLPISDLIWELFHDTGYLDYVRGMPGGRQRWENLKRLLELATSFDSYSRQGLPGFLHFIDGLRENRVDLGPATPDGDGEDAVQIMSIHKSKGLEFPVVFVVDLGREFNKDDLRAPVLVHRDLGLGPHFVDPERGIQSGTIARSALHQRLWHDALAEEMRVLYVAMTRARERLILVGSVRDLPKAVRQWTPVVYHERDPLPDAFIAGASGYLDWIVPCVARHRDGHQIRHAAGFAGRPANPSLFDDESRWHVQLHTGAAVLQLQRPSQNGSGPVPDGQEPEGGASQEQRALITSLERRLSGDPAFPAASRYFAKASVTELSRGFPLPAAADPGDDPPLDLATQGGKEQWEPSLPRLWRASGDAAAAVEPSPAEIGTATHLVFQHLDLSGDLSQGAVARQLEELVQRGVITAQQAALVPVDGIAAFFTTAPGRRLAAAGQEGRLRRELPFSLRLRADLVYGDGAPHDEWVLVQGVIDALWEEDGRLLLVDFKTDRVDRGQARHRARRYARQMDLYAIAARSIFQREVATAYIYFVAAGELVPFTPTQYGSSYA